MPRYRQPRFKASMLPLLGVAVLSTADARANWQLNDSTRVTGVSTQTEAGTETQSYQLMQFRPDVDIETRQDNITTSSRLFSDALHNARVVSVAGPGNSYRLQVFGAETDSAVQLSGTQVSLTDSRQRLGASLEINNLEHWQIQSSYITNHSLNSLTLDDSNGDVGNDQISNWNFTLNRRWLQDHLSTRVEYARSQQQTEADGVRPQDSAIDGLLELSSGQHLRLPGLQQWNAGVQFRTVGPEFYNLGNSCADRGSDQTRVYFRTSISQLAMELEWQNRIQDDYDWLNLSAYDQTRSAVKLTYSPDWQRFGLVSRLVNGSTLTTTYSQTDFMQPDDSGDPSLLRDTDELNLNWLWRRDNWHWRMQYTYSEQDNLTDSGSDDLSDWQNAKTRLELGLTPSDRFKVSMNMQWAEQLEAPTNNSYNQRLYEINAQMEVIPDTFDLAIQYNIGFSNSDLTSGDTETDLTTHNAHARLMWHLAKVDGTRSAMDLFLKSSYGRLDNQAAASASESWSAQLGITLYWSLLR